MNAFEKTVYFLQGEMTTPTLYGAFHLLALATVIALAVLASLKLCHAKERAVRRVLLGIWILLLFTELYKQIIFTVDVAGNVATWSYAWYAFPFQFCSSPLYVLPFAALLPEGRVRNACLCFLSTFSLFGGLAVMIYPGDVFMRYIGINLQTMIHHGSQVIVGIFLAVRQLDRFTKKEHFGGVGVFSVLALVAMLLNISVYHILRANGMDNTFNMFFISPYFDCTLPVLSGIAPLVPYPVFLALYLIGFSLIAALMFFAVRGIRAAAVWVIGRAQK